MYNIQDVINALLKIEKEGQKYADFNDLKDALLITGVSDEGALSINQYEIQNFKYK